MNVASVPIITIDGPSGSGKGTLAARLAEHYGFHLLDSGAIYRLLGLKLQQLGLLDQCHSQAAINVAQQLEIGFVATSQGVLVTLDGIDVSEQIRTEQVGSYASQVAAIPALRDALLQRQRDFARAPGLVADGRDMGTLVFPQAQAKLFLTASVESRAQRRLNQLQNRDQTVKIDGILADLQARDLRDTTRTVAPLRPAVDAFVIDSTELSIAEVFAQMCHYIDGQLPLSSGNG